MIFGGYNKPIAEICCLYNGIGMKSAFGKRFEVALKYQNIRKLENTVSHIYI